MKKTTANILIALPFMALILDRLRVVQGNANKEPNPQIDSLVKNIKQYNKAYRKGDSLISDAQYDDMIERLSIKHPENTWLKKVEPQFLTKEKVFHNPPMLSIKKTYTVDKLRKFLEDMKKTADKIGVVNPTILISPKLDGIAVDWSDGILSTRGDGEMGNDISKLVPAGLVFEPKDAEFEEFRGELVVDRNYFNKNLAKQRALPRNFIAGLANSKTISERNQQVLDDGAVRAVSFESFGPEQKKMFLLNDENIEFILGNIEYFHADLINSVPYDCDGIVLSIVNPELRDYIGQKGNNWGYQIAYKMRGEEKTTTITGIDWSIGRYGTLTPVVTFDPVYFNKVKYADGTVSGGIPAKRATAHNWRMYTQKGMGIGARIVVLMSGEVIPYVSQVLEPSSDTPYASHCPYCNTETVVKSPRLVCPNPTCRGALMKRILLFTSELEIGGFGEKTILKIVDAGFNRVSKMLNMTISDYRKAKIGLKTARKLMGNIKRSFRKGIPKATLIRALGIAKLGRGESNKLVDAYPDLNVIRLNEVKRQELQALKGIGPKTSVAIQQSLKTMWPQIESIVSHDFAVVEPQRTAPLKQKALRFVFTGKLKKGLKQIQRETRENGHIVETKISESTNYLVKGSKPGEYRMKTAKKLGIPVVSEKKFRELIQ